MIVENEKNLVKNIFIHTQIHSHVVALEGGVSFVFVAVVSTLGVAATFAVVGAASSRIAGTASTVAVVA
ncbi:Hypothetical predicted protein [Octopus vulgaris]|uniref:Uncharacterized protein n=1 Tax=Octopus vulgaris TaxID=6645 RepID=A0AA36EYT1_OCTVU|nr:Hypothetical predicted protein [Octopus vulgaris]